MGGKIAELQADGGGLVIVDHGDCSAYDMQRALAEDKFRLLADGAPVKTTLKLFYAMAFGQPLLLQADQYCSVPSPSSCPGGPHGA